MIAKSTPPLILIPVNLADGKEYTEFQRQRTICGWSFSDETLAFYREKQEQKLKSLFWITIPDPDAPSMVVTTSACGTTESEPTETEAYSTLRAGHISLDAYNDPPHDLDLAAADKSTLAIQNFFLLPEYRKLGLGHAAMDRLESLARTEPYGSPNCQFLALSTLSKRYIYQEGPEWRDLWAKFGMEVPEFSAHAWYETRGYELFKEEPRYPITSEDGKIEVKLVLAFLRKRVV
ncbi:uncharacterized protein LDX57_002739 [Aspergillus melleus]|uniref:uncharacterized protein n=1 Tax=Aspergillus melleus TaxID=138277 RepID=UPI001E8DD4FA|nr:uncharacterized protein LDX57_002739 [Aspergillus melleus]KAH8424993.1 hypothetical protein LDX57_002739 [Aspergillus melleus]